MRPSVPSCSPLVRLNSVVLPAPLGPMMARRSPGLTSRLTPSTARSPPNALETFERLSAAAGSAMASAVLAGREVAIVDGLLEELFRLVLPELRHVGKDVDHRVPQLPVLLLDLADVDVLDGVAVVVELDGAPRRVGDRDFPESGKEFFAVLHFAPHGLGRLVDPASGRVAGLRVVRRHLAILLSVLGHEALVDRSVDGGAVDEGTDPPDGLVAQRGQDELVERRAAADERQLGPKPGVLVLLGETERRDRRHQREDRVGVAPDLAQVGREVRGVERGPQLLDYLAAGLLEALLETAHLLPPEGVVHGDGHDLFVAEGLQDRKSVV